MVEDAAEALGSIAGGRNAATFGDLSALSFNGNKIMTTSGGGALLSDDADFAQHIRYLATQARQPAAHYEHTEIGYNYRMSNLLAGLGRAKLARLERGIARRCEIRQRYRQAFPDFTWLDSTTTERPNCWLSAALLPLGATPLEVCAALAAERIEARPLWKPMHAQPVFSRSERIGGEVADLMFDRGICLPSGSSMTDEDQTRVILALAKTLDRL